MLLISTGKVRRKFGAETLPGLNRPRSEVHEPSPGWPSQDYMKVARHDSVVATSCCDGGDVHLQEFRRISGTVVRLRQLWTKLGRPGHCAEMIREHGTAHPSNRGSRWCPGVSRELGCRCIQVGVEIVALDVQATFPRPFHGDAGVLTRAPVVELRPQVFCSRTPHRGGAHGCRRAALAPVVGYHRITRRRSLPSPCGTGRGLSQMEETVNVVPPLPQGVWRG